MYIVNCVHVGATGGVTPSPKKLAAAVKREGASPMKSLTTAAASSSSSTATDGPSSQDDLFRQFRHICAKLEKEPSYNAKTKIVSNFIKFGSSGGEGEREVESVYPENITGYTIIVLGWSIFNLHVSFLK